MNGYAILFWLCLPLTILGLMGVAVIGWEEVGKDWYLKATSNCCECEFLFDWQGEVCCPCDKDYSVVNAVPEWMTKIGLVAVFIALLNAILVCGLCLHEIYIRRVE